MKKTAFDKIVVGFVVFVVLIFALLLIYSIKSMQKTVEAEKTDNINRDITMIADGDITDYKNNVIDEKTLYDNLQHASEVLNVGIWFTDEDGNILFNSGSSSNQESNTVKKSRVANLADYIGKDKAFTSFTSRDTFGGYFSEDTLVIGQPLYSSGRYMGSLVLFTPMTFKDEIMANMLSTTFVPFLVLMVLSMLTLMLMSNSLLKPLPAISVS